MFNRIFAFSCAFFIILISAVAHSRPYRGDIFTFTQPDDTLFEVRLFGDEYFVVIESLDGYTLTQDIQTGFYHYAIPAADGMSLLSTGVKPGEPIPPGMMLKKHHRLAPQAVKQISEAARERFGVDSKGRLLPSLRLRLRPEDFGYERWTSSLEAEALKLESQTSPVLPGPPSSTTTGTRIGLVLLAEFPDRPQDVSITQPEVDAYVNDPNYTGFGNATSVYGYFNIQSDGKLLYNCIVTAYFTAAQNREYYTDNSIAFGTRAKELINEGLAVLKAQGFDFTKVDGNGNGVLDGVNLFYAGSRVNSWSQGLWPHKWSSSWAGLSGTGVSTGFQYQITDLGSSLSLGTFCHENGHMICNFPDLYSYSGNAAEVNNYSLMSMSGSTHPVSVDAYLKIHAGWSSVIDIDASSHFRGALQVDKNLFYRFRNPSSSNEYMLLSMRTNSGYEGVYGGSSYSVNPANGLVIYHALETGSNTYSSIFTAASPTDYSTPYELMVVEANPGSSTTPWYDDPNPGQDDGYHSGDISEASDATHPALKFWNTSTGRTTTSSMHVHSISSQGQAMSFVIGSGAVASSPEIGLVTSALAPTCEYGADAAVQSFSIFNSGGGTLNYAISESTSWLSLSNTSGTATTDANIVEVAYDTDGLPAGQYSAAIEVTDGGAVNSPQYVNVTLTVYEQPIISISDTTITASLASGQTAVSSFTLANSGGGTLNYTVSESTSWLSLNKSSGTVAAEEDEIEISFDATGLFDGIYNASILVTSDSATNSPQQIDVTLTVSGHIAVSNPNGGETIWQGNRHDIRWQTDGAVSGNVKIELNKGGVVSTIIGDTPNDGHFSWNVAADQTIGTDYRVRITSLNEPAVTAESLSDFSIAALPMLAAFPYSESFESGLGIWEQSSGDDFDWTQNSAGTPSSGTGPSAADDGSYYIYTESSSPNYPAKTAILGGYFDLRSAVAPLLSLSTHMYGADMGTLLVEASSDMDNWMTLLSLTGDQGNSWQIDNSDLAVFSGKAIVIRITGTTGGSYTSDMALDAFSLSDSARSLSYSTDMLTESAGDDGAFPGAVTIALSGDAYTADVVSGGYVTASNVPAGLTASFSRDSDTLITFSLGGNALYHDNADSINNLHIEFAESAFVGGNATTVVGRSKDITVDFIELVDSPEMSVQGNGQLIADGDTSPSTEDYTDFGSADIAEETIERNFTIINDGDGALNLSGTPYVALSGAAASDFSVTLQPSSTVASGGGTTTFTVRFDPTAVGLRQATLSIANNDSDENPYTFSIQGTGTAYAEMAVSGNGNIIVDGDVSPSVADSTDFGSANISGDAADRVFTITNNGSASLHLTGSPEVVVGGANASEFSVTAPPITPVAAGGGTTVFIVRFDPSGSGTRSATLSIGNDDGDENPYNFAIQGVGVSGPEIRILGNGVEITAGDTSPSEADFTDFEVVKLGAAPVDHTFTVQNTGSAPLTLTGTPKVAVSGTDSADFLVISDPATVVAAEGGTTTFTIRFIPGHKGDSHGVISINSDDADENPYVFNIEGTGKGFDWNLILPALMSREHQKDVQ